MNENHSPKFRIAYENTYRQFLLAILIYIFCLKTIDIYAN